MAKARLYFEGDNTGIEKEARLYSLTQEVEDKLDSISSIETTLQGEIDDLQDQINQVASRGRYLTTWDCTTGLPDTNPTTDPYTYRPGDYYIVGTVGGTNYRPHGSEYHVGVASQTLETQAVSANDLYIYDGTQWTLQRTGASVYAVWGSIAGNLQAQTDLQNALNDKANRTDVLEKTNTTSYTPTADYHPSTKKYSDDNDTYIGTSAPTNNVVEGRLWYDTAADVLKVYNGSQWVPTGKTYTAGQNIQISASDVISATDTTYNAGDNITIEDICTTESDMKGPCPSGFHVPLNTEWQAVRDIRVALGGGSSDGTNFGIALKLPFAGFRVYSSADVSGQGRNGRYWSSSRRSASAAYFLYFTSTSINPQKYDYRTYGFSVRCFKNSPTVPTSSWTKLYGTSIEAGGIFWSSTDGLISLSSDGNTWITIADKNLGATTVWNSGDTLSEANCGYYYQRGNNYGFPRTGTIANQSTTQVDASTYGPGNYYSSDTFIKYGGRWDTTDNGNLWGGVTQGTWQDCIHNVISATVPEAPNVKQFVLSGTSGATALAEAQDILDWYLAGNNPLLVYNNYTYILSSVANDKLGFKGAITQQNQNSSSFAGQDVIYLNFNGNNEVTSITTDTAVIAGSYLRLGQNYTTPYIPTNDGDPTSKKYVDEHGPNIPVYYYSGDFNNDITFNIIEAGEYRLYVRAYHGTTVDKTLTLTVDSVTVGTLTSNLIEHLNASINFTASAGSTAVLSVSSKTNFTIQEVYIEKVNIQSGYLTATVN